MQALFLGERQQVPHRRFAPVRNDKLVVSDRDDALRTSKVRIRNWSPTLNTYRSQSSSSIPLSVFSSRYFTITGV